MGVHKNTPKHFPKHVSGANPNVAPAAAIDSKNISEPPRLFELI